MKIALGLTGHLRADPLTCIHNNIEYLKNYSNNIDVFISTYENQGLHVSKKEYNNIENNYTKDLDTITEYISQIKDKFNPYFLKVDNFDLFQNNVVLPKSKDLIKKIQKEKKGPELKNPGLLTGLIAQSIQKSNLLNQINQTGKNKYDLILLTRPDVNLKGLKFINLDEKLYYVQTEPYHNKNRQVYTHNSKFLYNLSKQLFIGIRKVNLVGDLLYFGKSKIIEEFNQLFLEDIVNSIFTTYEFSPNYMNYTIGNSFNSLPNWEMPEYIIASSLQRLKLNYEKIACFDLHLDDNIRQFKLHKNLYT